MTNILSNIATPAGSTELTEVIAATLAQMTVGDISPVEAELRLTVIVYEEIRRARLEDYERLVRQLVEAGIIVSDSDRAKPAMRLRKTPLGLREPVSGAILMTTRTGRCGQG